MTGSNEVRYVLRSLRRSPLFTTTVVLTLALGIGATTSIFGIVNAVLLRPLPYPESERLVEPYHTLLGIGITYAAQSRGTYFHYTRTARTLESIAAWAPTTVNLADMSGSAEPERVHAARITATLLPTLRVQPERGRGFTASEDMPNGDHVALISDGLWHRRFGGDPSILTRNIRVDGDNYRIVGVMPPDFHYPDPLVELWIPLRLDPAARDAEGFAFAGVARLAPNATIESAKRELTARLATLPESYPNIYPGLATSGLLQQAKARALVHSLRDTVVGNFGGVLWVVAATVCLVLIVTCANVVNLLLVRAQGRAREVAVRAALGATQGRLLALLMTEAAILALAGAAIGLGLAELTTKLLLRAGFTTFPRWNEIGVDVASFAFTLGITALVALTCGVFPALRYRAMRFTALLREGGRTGTVGRERHRAQRTLIVIQVALALLLLAGCGLLTRTVSQLRRVKPGFDPSHTLAFTVSLPPGQYPKLVSVPQFYSDVLERIRALPGVEAVGAGSRLPLQGGAPLAPVFVEKFPVPPGSLPQVFPFPLVTAGYFQAMRIHLLAGRLFPEEIPPSTAPREVVVSRGFAERYWHDSTGQRALGERIRASLSETAPWSTIVGVVEGVRDTSLVAPPLAEVYFPIRALNPATPDSLQPFTSRVMSIVVRTSGDPLALVGAVRREIRAVNASVPIFDVEPMTAVLERVSAQTRFALFALGAAAAITLVLGALGLYGVIAYVVSLRTRELGLRMALGAEPSSVLGLVLRDGVTLALIGIVAGLVAFAIVGQFLRGLLFGVAPNDPVTLIGVVLIVVIVSAVASWLPAWRASRIDPLEALRLD
jgi:putative ABC transport system permease protein